tara:strand:+ start:2579 stop:3373 length:795 start_codon:yes stop_codon:yes gene_type:complete
MTVSNLVTRNQLSANGTVVDFAYTFKIFDDSDLKVILTDSDGVDTVQVLTADYTVSGVGTDGGGNVTFGTAPANGLTVTILRNTAITQATDYVINDSFPASSHENALDRLTIINQHQQDRIDRSIKTPDSEVAGYDMTLPAKASRLGVVLGFDSSTGNPIAGPKISDFSTLTSIAADIATLADLEDGTVATTALSRLAAIDTDMASLADIIQEIKDCAAGLVHVTPISRGGTGATTLADAQTNLGIITLQDASDEALALAIALG